MATIPNPVFNEIFSQELKDKLFEKNTFLSTWNNVSSYLSGRVVHIPNYTNTPKIYIDGAENGTGPDYAYGFDTVATQETDLTFLIKSYRFEPIRVEDFDEMVTNYDKFAAVTRNSVNALSETMGKHLLHGVAVDVTSGRTFDTSGAAGTGNGPAGSNKNKLVHQDFLTLARLMDEDNLEQEGRYIQLSPVMYYELLEDAAVRNSQDFGITTLPEGVVRKIAGINILTPKPTVVATDGSGAILAVDATLTGTDAFAGMAWVTSSIAAAWSSPKVFTNSGVAQLYGNVVSGEYAAGAALSRTDGKGLYVIQQGS